MFSNAQYETKKGPDGPNDLQSYDIVLVHIETDNLLGSIMETIQGKLFFNSETVQGLQKN